MTDHTPDAALLAKAETLTEALPYLQRYAGQTFVVKYGGHAMGDPELQRDFAEDVVLLKAVGINPVVVHGGGPQIGAMLKRLGVESEFVNGLRVTDAQTAQIAEMVLAGSINKDIVGWIGQAGGRAVGISGKDAGLVQAEKVGARAPDRLQGIERHVDLGFVGEPVSVDRRILDTLSAAGIIPVVAPVGFGADGHTYNINADTMAGAIAAAVGASRFFLLTDVAGVLDKQGDLLTDLSPADVAALRADGTISGGMIPKLETCVAAVGAGVDAAVILDGRIPHAMLLEIFTRRGVGTLVSARGGSRAGYGGGSLGVLSRAGRPYNRRHAPGDIALIAIFQIVQLLLNILWWIIVIQAVLSWLIAFNVINTHSDFVRSVWNALQRITEPLYRPIRRILPDFGALDLAPLVVLLIIYILNTIVLPDIYASLVTGTA